MGRLKQILQKILFWILGVVIIFTMLAMVIMKILSSLGVRFMISV